MHIKSVHIKQTQNRVAKLYEFSWQLYRQNLFLGSYSSTLLIIGNFRQPACPGFTSICVYIIHVFLKSMDRPYNHGVQYLHGVIYIIRWCGVSLCQETTMLGDLFHSGQNHGSYNSQKHGIMGPIWMIWGSFTFLGRLHSDILKMPWPFFAMGRPTGAVTDRAILSCGMKTSSTVTS